MSELVFLPVATVKSYIFWDVMKCSPGRREPAFRENTSPPPFLPWLILGAWRRRPYVLPEGWLTLTGLHGIIYINRTIHKKFEYCGTGNQIFNTTNIGDRHQTRSSTSHCEIYRVISKFQLMLSLTLLFGLPKEGFPRAFLQKICINSQFPHTIYMYSPSEPSTFQQCVSNI